MSLAFNSPELIGENLTTMLSDGDRLAPLKKQVETRRGYIHVVSTAASLQQTVSYGFFKGTSNARFQPVVECA